MIYQAFASFPREKTLTFFNNKSSVFTIVSSLKLPLGGPTCPLRGTENAAEKIWLHLLSVLEFTAVIQTVKGAEEAAIWRDYWAKKWKGHLVLSLRERFWKRQGGAHINTCLNISAQQLNCSVCFLGICESDESLLILLRGIGYVWVGWSIGGNYRLAP